MFGAIPSALTPTWFSGTRAWVVANSGRSGLSSISTSGSDREEAIRNALGTS
jgi:hypothetical protein